MRDIIFISHANPEDNEFARWLALRLAAEGYGVWCDLTKLLGGEAFWSDIETAIRTRSAKVVYVLSTTSNQKAGPLAELQVAQNVARDESIQDFVIPVAIDALPARQANIALARINAISFRDSWAAGVAQLLKKLEQDDVPQHPDFSASAVAAWWREQYGADAGVRDVPEDYISNVVAIDQLPETIFVHRLRGRARPTTAVAAASSPLFPDGTFAASPAEQDAFLFPELWSMKFASARSGSRLISFAGTDDLFSGDEDFLVESISLPLATYLADGSPEDGFTPVHARNHVTDLLRVGWERVAKTRGLWRYKMATKHGAMYFPLAATRHGKIDYVNINGKRTYRKVVGEKKRPKRYWHFAVSARPLLAPSPVFALRLHVTFSDNGHTIWDSPSKLHSARRSQCKNWWNEQWRDRMLATLQYLANGATTIVVPLSSTQRVQVDPAPIRFQSPVSFVDPNTEEFVEGGADEDDDA
ncbi:MAG: toll/interleukin-1 receptor domain-containing protein [Acidobacteriota bacterium]